MMLKEWSTVVGAMEAGEHSVLLRKGGIMEISSGFEVKTDKFLLYPTWEHQDAYNIRDPYRYHLSRPQPPQGTNSISSYAKVLAQADVSSQDVVKKLEPFHIWSESYIQTRRRWQPQKPLKAIFVQTFRIEPISMQVSPEHAGCRSWLQTDMEIPPGVPVQDQQSTQNALQEFRRIVS